MPFDPYLLPTLITPWLCVAIPIVAGQTYGREWRVWFGTN